MDGKISDKEKVTLLKRARELGIEEDEFEIYLNSKIYDKKKARVELFLSYFKNYFKDISFDPNDKKSKIKLLFKIALPLFIILIPLTLILHSNKEKEQDVPCENIDDCLGKYKFEEARKLVSQEEGSWDAESIAMRKIVFAEAYYWVKNKEYEKALNVIDETSALAMYSYGTDNYRLKKKNKIRTDILNRIIEKIIYEEDFKKAKKWVLKIDTQSEQKRLLKKIETAEKLSK